MNHHSNKLKNSTAIKSLNCNREFDSSTKAWVYFKGYLPLEIAIKDKGFIAGLTELHSKYPLNSKTVKKIIDDEKVYNNRQEVVNAIETHLQQLQWAPHNRNQYPKLLKIIDKHAHLFTKKRYLKKIFDELRHEIIEQSRKHYDFYQDYKQGKAFLDKTKLRLCIDKLEKLPVAQCKAIFPVLDFTIDKLIDNPLLEDAFEKIAFKKLMYAYSYIFIKGINSNEPSSAENNSQLAKTIKYTSFLLKNDSQCAFNKAQLYYWRALCYSEQKQSKQAFADLEEALKEPNTLDKNSYEKAVTLKNLYEAELLQFSMKLALAKKVIEDKNYTYPKTNAPYFK